MKKTLLACLFSTLSISAFAQIQTPPQDGFLVDSSNHAVRSSDGNCVRTGFYDAKTAYHPDCTPIKAPEVAPVVVPAPTPAPTPVAAPIAQVKTVRINFAFDSAKLSSEAKQKIDNFLADNSTARKEVKVEAGTDYIGSNAYNDRLSQRRAKAVADYVESKSQFKVTSIVGLGESEAHLQNSSECKAVKGNRQKLIRCIADDRFGLVTITID